MWSNTTAEEPSAWRYAPDGFWTSASTLLLATGVATYLLSSVRGSLAARRRSFDERPPMLPYAVPLLGHLPNFLYSLDRFFEGAMARYGRDIPVRFKLANRHMSLLKGPSNIVALFKSSRDLSSEHWLVQVLVNAFGVEPADAPFYLADDSGLAHLPDPSSHGVAPEHRIFYLVYKSVHEGLTGARIAEMERRFVMNLSSQLTQADVSDEWTTMDDFYGDFVRNKCFTSAVTSLCGSRIFDVIPTFAADFWAFDGHLPSLFKEMPRWLSPASYKSRDLMKEHVKRWHAYSHTQYDITEAADDPREWEEYFGSRLMRARQEFFHKMPLSRETVAADDLGLIWAATANAIPGIGWMLLEVLQRPDLLARVREEVKPFISKDPANSDRLVVDIDSIANQTLVQSIYAEVLRCHNGTVINRVPRTPDFAISGWRFRQNEPIIVSTYNTARDPTVWSQGTAEEPHPLDQFWAERFIVYPNQPSSGPTLAARAAKKNDGASGPRFSMNGTEGSWVPYGGGSRMCPGRHFAKRELIFSMAIFVTLFDIELQLEPGVTITNDLNYFMFGVMHPKEAVPARIRRRNF